MIDVVFLLLVFFMLAARFGQEVLIPLSTTGSEAAYAGPPRLIVVTEETVLLNGAPLPLGNLAARLEPLITGPQDVVFIQPSGAATLQHLVDVLDVLGQSGISNVTVVARP